MISPPARSATAIARLVLPLAVGPTTARTASESSSMIRSPRSTWLSATNPSLQLVERDAGHDRTAVGAVAGEVDGVEGAQERLRLFARERVPRARRAVAGH